MYHFVRTRNLLYSMEDVKQMTKACRVCAKCKPQFHIPAKSHLVKATQLFERLNVDFKGPLKSNNQNIYFLNIIDEYSRFPFVFPCKDVSTASVIQCFCTLFSLFGMPAYIHSDRGASFMSEELRQFLLSKGIATSRTTPNNPQCNGQVEKYNGVVWKAIIMALKTRGLPALRWQDVLPDALHSLRSLLCTATNCTPREWLFKYERKSSCRGSVPTWLSYPGPVLLKRHIRVSKSDLLVDEFELIEANPQYAHIRHADGREATVSIRHLAPCGEDKIGNGNQPNDSHCRHLSKGNTTESELTPLENTSTSTLTTPPLPEDSNVENQEPTPTIEAQGLRRSQRSRREPDYFSKGKL